MPEFQGQRGIISLHLINGCARRDWPACMKSDRNIILQDSWHWNSEDGQFAQPGRSAEHTRSGGIRPTASEASSWCKHCDGSENMERRETFRAFSFRFLSRSRPPPFAGLLLWSKLGWSLVQLLYRGGGDGAEDGRVQVPQRTHGGDGLVAEVLHHLFGHLRQHTFGQSCRRSLQHTQTRSSLALGSILKWWNTAIFCRVMLYRLQHCKYVDKWKYLYYRLMHKLRYPNLFKVMFKVKSTIVFF